MEITEKKPSDFMVAMAAIICCILWGTAFKLIKMMNVELGVSQEALGQAYLGQGTILIGLRFVLAGFMTLIYAIVKKQNIFAINKKEGLDIIKMGIMSTAVAYFFFNIGNINITSTINSAIVSQSAIFFGVILSHFVYENDRLNRSKLLALGLGFLGLIISQVNQNLDINQVFNISLTGEGFMLIYGLVAAISTIMSKRITTGLNTFVMTGWNLLIGGLILVLVGLFMGGSFSYISWTGPGLTLLIILGLNSAIPFSLWYWAAKYGPISQLSMYRFVVPISGSLLAILMGESLTFPLTIGLGLVSFSIFLMNRKKGL